MLAAELELADLDARQWRNWWRLLSPPHALDAPAWALVVVDGAVTKPLKVIVSGRGTVTPTPAYATLAELAKTLRVGMMIALDRRVIGELSAEIEGALQPQMDGVAQALVALRVLKKHADRGIWTEPSLLDVLPAPHYEPLQKTFDLLVPDGSAMAAYVIDDDRARIYTSIIAVKRGGDLVRAATHRALADAVPEAAFARDWQNQYKRVLEHIERRFAKPTLAIFLERATWQRIVSGPTDQLSRELDAKHVVIDPLPTWLMGLLSGAAVAAMAGRAARGIANMLPQGARDRASALAHRAQTVMKESGAHPFALLGFDPIELWQRLRHHYKD